MGSEPTTNPADDNAPDGAEPAGATIKARADGPFLVTGDFTITDHTGAVIESGDNVVLCRCGRSATKPFCDGSHRIGQD